MVVSLLRRLGVGRAIQRVRQLRAMTVAGTIRQARDRRRFLGRIVDLPSLDVTSGPVEVHMLLNGARLHEGMWGLYSFVLNCEEACSVVVHDDGTLGSEGVSALERLLPGVRIVSRAESDAAAVTALAEYPRTARLRETLIFTLKLIDPFLFSACDSFVVMDSDVLLFAPFSVAALRAEGRNRYSLDLQDNYCITRASAPLVDRFNPGVLLAERGVLDLDLVERLLAIPAFWTEDGRGHYFAELTLWAALLGQAGATPLPTSYAICPDPSDPATVAGHYCGGAVPRTWFYTKGLPQLVRDT